MGLTSWKNALNGKIVKADVSIAKNYLQQDELQELNEIVTMYLDYATRQARRHIPMTMQDWAEKLDAFLQFNDAEILKIKERLQQQSQRLSQKVNLKSTALYRTGSTKAILTAL